MKLLYPYNEILPKKTAHDVYVYQNACSLAQEGIDVTLAIGKGSFSPPLLATHYGIEQEPQKLQLLTLPIWRKSGPLRLSWNRIFFRACQAQIKKERPDIVVCSVLKQGAYHFQRKVPGVTYVYELHQLAWYPGMDMAAARQAIQQEKAVLSLADRIVVTTKALKEILLAEPYQLMVPIKVVPLGVRARPLPLPLRTDSTLKLMYVGQLYSGQGLDLLLEAMVKTPDVELEIIGGSPQDLAQMRLLATQLGVAERVFFHGFCSPKDLDDLVAMADAFVAPFHATGKMAHVAHTKLYEYARWGRPVIAPALPVVEEHFPGGKGLLAFTPDSATSLAEQINRLKDTARRQMAQKEIVNVGKNFSWEHRASQYSKYLATLCSAL